MLLQSLYFSRPPPPTPPTRAIIPDARPLGTFENQDVAVTVRRGISKRSHEKIGDCEQSNSFFSNVVRQVALFAALFYTVALAGYQILNKHFALSL